MKRKLEIILFSALILFVFGCNSDKQATFSIKGELELAENSQVKLLQLGISKAEIVDSIKLDKAKSFELTGDIDQPSLFSLRIQGHDDIFLIIHPKDDLSIAIDNTNSPATHTVAGSVDSRLTNQILTQQKRVLGHITDLSIEYENSKRNPENFEEHKLKFDSIYDNLLLSHKEYTTAFIKENPRSLACIFALYQNFGRKEQALYHKFDDIEIFNFVDSNLTPIYPQTEAVIALNRDVTEIKEQLKHKKFTQGQIEPGRKAPQFELTSIKGEHIVLNKFEGEPVVFFFFAVWNEQAKLEAIQLNELLKKSAYRKLNLVGVSFDSSPEKLQFFIDENEISYPIACDYKYWESEYVNQFGILALPDILLLDQNHIVHAKNINTQELIQILSEWKKSKLF